MRFQICRIPSLFRKSESVGFVDPFSVGFGFDFHFGQIEFYKNQLPSADSLTLIDC